jgi:hypothetical protein
VYKYLHNLKSFEILLSDLSNMRNCHYMIGGLPALRRTTAFDAFEQENKRDKYDFLTPDVIHRSNPARLAPKVQSEEVGDIQDDRQELSRARVERFFSSMNSLKRDSWPRSASDGIIFHIRDVSLEDDGHSVASTAIRTISRREATTI